MRFRKRKNMDVRTDKEIALSESEFRKRYKIGFIKGIVTGVIICCIGIVFISWWGAERKITVYVTGGDGSAESVKKYEPIAGNKDLEKINYLAAFIQANYYKDVDKEDLLNAMYKGMFESLDQYSDYYTEDEYKQLLEEDVTGEFSGIGAALSQDEKTGEVIVHSVQSDSPAEKAGLKSGDIILKADGYKASDMEISDFISHIKGKEGTQIQLTIERDGKELSFTVTREKIETQTVKDTMLEDRIGYIQITEFTNSTPDQFETALKELKQQNMQGLIVDLRNNPGGMLNAVTDVLDDILPKGMMVYTEDKWGNRQEYKSTDEKVLSVPIAVLINENSASASEIFAGAVKDRDYGTLIGTKTFGKGIVQGIQEFTDKTAVKLTTSRYYTPSGVCIQGKGIEPDIELDYEFLGKEGQEYSYNLDNQIQKALEVIKQQLN